MRTRIYPVLLLVIVVISTTMCRAPRLAGPTPLPSVAPSLTDPPVPTPTVTLLTRRPTVTPTPQPSRTPQLADLATPRSVTLRPDNPSATLEDRLDANQMVRYLLRGRWTQDLEIELHASQPISFVFQDANGTSILDSRGKHLTWKGEPPATETGLIEIRSREAAYYTLTVALRSAAAEPSITVVTPDGGEVWLEGSTYTISWRSSGVAEVDIEIASGGKPLGVVALGLDATLKEYAWDIPVGLVSNFGVAGSDAMWVRISDSRNPGLFDENDDPFTVQCPRIAFEPGTTSTTITGTLPVGRDSYRYALSASADQALELTVSPPRLRVDVWGTTEGSTWQIPAGEEELSIPVLPAAQDYIITLIDTTPGDEAPLEYVLHLAIR